VCPTTLPDRLKIGAFLEYSEIIKDLINFSSLLYLNQFNNIKIEYIIFKNETIIFKNYDVGLAML
jgi:hypothetical protein